MEQLVWAIIILVFIIFTALKNRARSRPDTCTDKIDNAEYQTRKEPDRISRYMEELLGIEIPEAKPHINRKGKIPKSYERIVKPKPKAEQNIEQLESPLAQKHKEKIISPFPEKKNIYCSKFHWGGLSKKDLPRAIVLSEILGPPISKRKDRRLY